MKNVVRQHRPFQRRVSRRCENHNFQKEQKKSFQIEYTEFKVLTGFS